MNMYCIFIQEQLTVLITLYTCTCQFSMHEYNLSVYWCIFVLRSTPFLIFYRLRTHDHCNVLFTYTCKLYQSKVVLACSITIDSVNSTEAIQDLKLMNDSFFFLFQNLLSCFTYLLEYWYKKYRSTQTHKKCKKNKAA